MIHRRPEPMGASRRGLAICTKTSEKKDAKLLPLLPTRLSRRIRVEAMAGPEKTSDAMHMQPLNFPLDDLDSLSSTSLSLVQFRRDAKQDVKDNAALIWQERRQDARENGGGSETAPGFDNSHSARLDFSLDDLRKLSSDQLVLVQHHSDGDDYVQKAALLFLKRRNADSDRGIVWRDPAGSVGAAAVEILVDDEPELLQDIKREEEEEWSPATTTHAIPSIKSAPLPLPIPPVHSSSARLPSSRSSVSSIAPSTRESRSDAPRQREPSRSTLTNAAASMYPPSPTPRYAPPIRRPHPLEQSLRTVPLVARLDPPALVTTSIPSHRSADSPSSSNRLPA